MGQSWDKSAQINVKNKKADISLFVILLNSEISAYTITHRYGKVTSTPIHIAT